MRRALIVVGKAPEAGKAKTRLVPPLTYAAAAQLYRGFLMDAVRLGLDLGWERTTLIHPVGSAATLSTFLPKEVQLLEQRGRGLGDALSEAFSHYFSEGFLEVVLIGSDNPTLPPEPIIQAASALAEHDVVLGPSIDGGYYLIGLRAPHPDLFVNIDWSTDRVYRQTVERVKSLGLELHRVREWYDIDEPGDLDRLLRELQSVPLSIAPNTRAAMRALGDQLGGTRTVGVRPDRDAYVAAMRSPATRPEPSLASMTTEPPNPPPVIRAP